MGTRPSTSVELRGIGRLGRSNAPSDPERTMRRNSPSESRRRRKKRKRNPILYKMRMDRHFD
jgi:hypothetical protein